MSTSGSYFDDWLEFYKEEDNELIECTLMTGSWEIIEHINNMKICENDPYVMIVKDSWFGENSDGDDVGYVSFEVLDGEELPTLKGGEYDKKSFKSLLSFRSILFSKTRQFSALILLERSLLTDSGEGRVLSTTKRKQFKSQLTWWDQHMSSTCG